MPAHPLIKGRIEVMRPESGQIIYDIVRGSGGFLLASYNYITNNYYLGKERQKRSLLILMPLKERIPLMLYLGSVS